MKLRYAQYVFVYAILILPVIGWSADPADESMTVAHLREQLAQQQKQIETLTATVQKVSDQVALSKPAPQLVTNP